MHNPGDQLRKSFKRDSLIYIHGTAQLFFLWCCTSNHLRYAWEENHYVRTADKDYDGMFIEDVYVEDLLWLSEYMLVWLLKCNGAEAIHDAQPLHEIYEEIVRLNGEKHCFSRGWWPLDHDCALHARETRPTDLESHTVDFVRGCSQLDRDERYMRFIRKVPDRSYLYGTR